MQDPSSDKLNGFLTQGVVLSSSPAFSFPMWEGGLRHARSSTSVPPAASPSPSPSLPVPTLTAYPRSVRVSPKLMKNLRPAQTGGMGPPSQSLPFVSVGEKGMGREKKKKNLCFRCGSAEASTRILPCNHVAYCQVCAREVNGASRSLVQKCPLCPAVVDLVVQAHKPKKKSQPSPAT